MFLNLGAARDDSARQTAPETSLAVSGVYTLISGDLTVIGDVIGDGHIEISGTVKGTVNGRTVEIMPTGIVEGAVIAESATIHGSVIGPVRASTVTAGTTARIVGSIFHNVLTIEPGAKLEGRRPWRPHIDRNLDTD